MFVWHKCKLKLNLLFFKMHQTTSSVMLCIQTGEKWLQFWFKLFFKNTFNFYSDIIYFLRSEKKAD